MEFNKWHSTVLAKTIEEGFTEHFIFDDGYFCSVSNPSQRYLIKDVEKFPRTDLQNRVTVYTIVTPGNIKGFALYEWEDVDEHTVYY